MTSGVKKILHQTEAEDDYENNEKFYERDISHIPKETIEKLYKTRLSAEMKEKIHGMWQQFLGTKKYHNYTKDTKASDMAANRYMMELTANSFMYVNQNTFELTNSDDPDAIEFIHFFLKGQSFLFNQIRKMIGCMIQVLHGNLGEQFIANSQKDNVLNVALAPGDGLLCEKVAFEKYNSLPSTNEPIMLRKVTQKQELDEFRKQIISAMAQREIKNKAFLCYLAWFDGIRANFYVPDPK